ncbi:hypothetical protein M413DRAFT_16082 [Hebeloma cylindrosporum]|uniref:Uncharacterized protein n=1 Tax=Hebeloma cylindrosporum TaxID=76867 RepID=A0A0C3CV77_HEBCY|nr:hypothetical protein M413DRAFT_16082 [Hebeloma cylindrosporum h7]
MNAGGLMEHTEMRKGWCSHKPITSVQEWTDASRSCVVGGDNGDPFTPRREFIKHERGQPNQFALLAISSANCIRLYAFSPHAVAALRRLFDAKELILSFREDAVQNMCEFALDGKPWANPKSVPTEKLLVDIIAVVYHCGYTYLSTIDYGREVDDRLAMAFATLLPNPPSPRSPVPAFKNDCSTGSLLDTPKTSRIPFAISFSSVTVMRVIAPPLHLTPAILQAVRASWPRGVVAEKKVGDNSYEFKLKGYKCKCRPKITISSAYHSTDFSGFQQDTFATDSLTHILSLLTSLDSHSFTLLTSISLTHRSRVKDLWIFTGPTLQVEDSSEQSLVDISGPLLPTSPFISPFAAETSFSPSPQSHHRKVATDPSPSNIHSPSFEHTRATTDNSPPPRFAPSQPHVLRKPAPRAQVPVSVVQDADAPEDTLPLRTHMPSTISAGVENMTGIGTSPNILYTASPFDADGRNGNASPTPISPVARGHGRAPVSDRVKTPPLLTASAALPSPQKPSLSEGGVPKEHTSADSHSPPLLGIGTFRDSALSYEIPIKWTGPVEEEPNTNLERSHPKPNRLSSTPMFPGGWQPTPIEEKEEGLGQQRTPSRDGGRQPATTPIHEIGSRVEAPDIVKPDISLRKSEAALVRIIQDASPPPPSPNLENSPRKEPQNAAIGGGQGWVLVNVENSNNPSPTVGPDGPLGDVQSPEPSSSSGLGPCPTEDFPAAAKAIVIIDAMGSKHKKSQSTSNPKDSREGSSGVRRFFSLNKKNSIAPNSIPRSNLRDRLRLIGTPEASRKENKRRSID